MPEKILKSPVCAAFGAEQESTLTKEEWYGIWIYVSGGLMDAAVSSLFQRKAYARKKKEGA
ncbi:MAG: hypothetical protein Q7S82_02800 [bacterium]|nr:hypothetical protein [bacterium]